MLVFKVNHVIEKYWIPFLVLGPLYSTLNNSDIRVLHVRNGRTDTRMFVLFSVMGLELKMVGE